MAVCIIFCGNLHISGGSGEPIGVRYSLGWTVMGPVGDAKEGSDYSVNLIQSSHVGNVPGSVQVERFLDVNSKPGNVQLEGIPENSQRNSCDIRIGSNAMEFSRPMEEEGLIKEAECKDFQDHMLKQQVEGLWKTDFGDTLVNTRPSHSMEDKRALNMMQESFVKVNGHYQVALPWRSFPPYLPDNR